MSRLCLWADCGIWASFWQWACWRASRRRNPFRKLAPIPDAAAVREANAKIKSLFASDIAKIKSSNDRLALSTKLFLASQDPQVELPRKYALLNLSLTYAYPTNYAIIPMPIVDELYSSFRIPDSKAKTDVLAKAAKSRDNQILEEAIDLGLKWIDQAIADDRYDLARQFADSAAAMANASKDLDRIKAVNARLATIANLKTAYAPLQKDAHLVASNDPDALARAGSFCCFTKNQWDKGLAFLAASSDPALKTPAKMEIAHPAAPIDQVRLADAWWDASAKQPAAIQRSIQLHACSWYKLALPDLVGLVKFRVTHRLKDAPAGPVEPRFKELLLDLGNDVTMKFLLLPAGTFKMGSPPKTINLQTYGGERQITLTKPFYMSVFPVTQRQYKQIIGKNLSHTKSPDNPVDSVSWTEAVAFCDALSRKTGKKVKLPTEAQWEYACRAGTTTLYNYGGNWRRHLPFYGWPAPPTRPVGARPPNAWGLYDMPGNVAQWCSDYNGMDLDRTKDATDPQGSDHWSGSGPMRITRGAPNPDESSVAGGSAGEEQHDPVIGFRVIVVPDEPASRPTTTQAASEPTTKT